jgi:hypothetical protein
MAVCSIYFNLLPLSLLLSLLAFSFRGITIPIAEGTIVSMAHTL